MTLFMDAAMGERSTVASAGPAWVVPTFQAGARRSRLDGATSPCIHAAHRSAVGAAQVAAAVGRWGPYPRDKPWRAGHQRSPATTAKAGRPQQLFGTGAPSPWAAVAGAAAGSFAAWKRWLAVRAGRAATAGLLRPGRRRQAPLAEVVFALVFYGAIRAVVRSYYLALDSFTLRDELFQEMAAARTYGRSIIPWIQTGVIALVASIFTLQGIKMLMRSMKEWEEAQEIREMQAMGEDALFLISTPIDATPLERMNQFKKRRRNRFASPFRFFGLIADTLWILRLAACVGYLLPLLNVLDFGEMSISLYPYPMGVPPTEPIVNFMQKTLKMRHLHNAYIKSGNYFLLVWFLFVQLAVRNKSAPWFVRFHSSQAILMSMLLAVPQQIFFAVLNPWESGLAVQSFMYHSMVSLFLFTIVLIVYCCFNALLKKQMSLPLISEAAVMWAGRE